MAAKGDGDGAAKKTTKKKKTTAKKKTAKKTTAKKATKKKTTTKKKTAKKTTKKAATTAPKAAAEPAAAPAKQAAPKKTASKASGGSRVRVRQIRSSIGHPSAIRRTLEALGIRHHQGEVVVTQNPAIVGMLNKVRHLVRVTPEE